MKYRLGIRIAHNSLIKGLKYQFIVVASAYDIGNNRTVIQIQNGTEVEFVVCGTVVPLKLSYIRYPFFVWFRCAEITLQDVLCGAFRIRLPVLL